MEEAEPATTHLRAARGQQNGNIVMGTSHDYADQLSRRTALIARNDSPKQEKGMCRKMFLAKKDDHGK